MPASGLDLQAMRDLVREGLGGLDEEDIDDPRIDRLLNLSYWALESRFPFIEKNIRVSFDLVVDQTEYDITTVIETPFNVDLESVQSLGMFGDPNNVSDAAQSYPMQRMSETWYDNIRNTRPEDAKGRPTMYLRRDNLLVFYPIPDKTYKCSIFFWKSLKSLLAGSIDATNFPREWDELVVEGAIERGLYYTQDYNLAQQAGSMTAGKVRTAVPIQGKDEEDSHYAGLTVQWDNPADRTDSANIASDDPFPAGSRWFWGRGRRRGL